MKTVFADTFYWVALTNERDLSHRLALDLTRSLAPIQIVTTEPVLIEYLNFFAERGPLLRARAAANVQAMAGRQSVRVVPHTRSSFESGLALYQSRLDKGYSLTDCISMATMREQRVEEALTNDRHFEQEGFRALFRS